MKKRIIAVICFLLIVVLPILLFPKDSDKEETKSNISNKETKKHKFTYKDIEKMSDKEIKNLSSDEVYNLPKSARNLYDDRANELSEDYDKDKENNNSYEENSNFEKSNNYEDKTELDASIKQHISRSIHNLNVHSGEDVKKYEVTTQVDSRNIEKPNVNIIVYLKGEFKGAAEFNDEKDIFKGYEEYVSSNFINDRGMYGRQFNNIKIEFYYKDLPYAYTEINVNDKYNKGKLLEDDKINFY
ncbi:MULTISPECIES: hypothetical protein [Staphylococcus]|uniref:hypothetical protein n=1 Tax=Staphylococcus TaxID=1279 RepID=UPI0004D4BB56|nr:MULTISPECIES: hypothetical protein [Staphylococcus]KEA32401.1 hypothetical protein BF21_06750 [Staphylococcus epidermidis]MCG1045052.1 hypothetical protein [Staphylococcus epidermidis]MCG1136605.1 hypothetical protein [Staphylococcus epidermidis]MCG1686223.1 hypothetical protein [Staphylococcus epidermidis]MCG2174461.1 hypothetical protein [Staphylococcus epidermidis]